MTTVFISDDGVKDDTFIKVSGKYAEGVYATGPRDTSSNPLAIAAIEAHKKNMVLIRVHSSLTLTPRRRPC